MKKALIILVGSAAAIFLAAVIFVLTFNINSYRPSIEAAASAATGMNFRINGKMKLTLFPQASVSLEDILIQNNGKDIASVNKAEVVISLPPLLRGELLIRQIGLTTPSFFISKDKSGHFNVETNELPTGNFKMKDIFIKGGHLLYLDEISGRKTEANECEIAISNLFARGGEVLRTLSFDGDLSCREVKSEELRISDVDVIIKARRGEFEANPLTMKIFGGDGNGSIKGVMTGESPEYSVDFAVTKLRFEEVLGQFKQKKTTRGELNMKSHFTMKGKNADEMAGTARGEISLWGQNLFHESLDLDLMLKKYERSQNFNLVDAGAFFVAGPLGTLLTKGYTFGSVYEESLGGKSTILKLVSDWTIKNGVAVAEDVAFSTRQSRVALKGRLDFVNEQFGNVTVAVLDEKGCVRFSQKIDGPFRHPHIEKVSALRSIANPILNMYLKTKKLLQGGKCEIFYAGSVTHPK